MIDWVILALIATFIWAIANLLDKVLSTKYCKDSVALTGGLGLVSFFVSFILLGFFYEPLPQSVMIAAIAGGALITFVLIPYIKALSLEEASRVIPLWNLSPVFTLILALIFLDEILDTSSYIAFVILLAGGLLVSVRRAGKIIHISPAVGLMIFSSLVAAVADVSLKFAYTNAPFMAVFSLTYASFAISSVVLLLRARHRKNLLKAYHINKMWFTMILILSAAGGKIGFLLYSLALVTGPVTLVSVFEVFQGVFVLAIATFLSIKYPLFIKEAIDPRTIVQKLIAIALMAIGLLLL